MSNFIYAAMVVLVFGWVGAWGGGSAIGIHALATWTWTLYHLYGLITTIGIGAVSMLEDSLPSSSV